MKARNTETLFNGIDRLHLIANAYRSMPNGGAILMVWDNGKISNGYVVLGEYGTKRNAEKILRQRGFRKVYAKTNMEGWKLR